MLNKTNLALSLGAALGLAIAIPAGAADFEYTGSDAGWELVQPAYSHPSFAKRAPPQVASAGTASERASGPDDFRYIGGEGGWQLEPDHYVFSGGHLAHAPDDDRTLRPKPPLPTAAQIEATNRLYGGA